MIQNLLTKVDGVLVGGGMIYTFYKARDIPIGDSLLESNREEMAREILDAAKSAGVDLVLPVDSVVSAAADGSEPFRTTEGPAIPEGSMGVDIGPATIDLFRRHLASARTVVWNGPMGIFEVPAFAEGTRAIAEEVARAAERGATTIVGGGDSVAALHQMDVDRRITHVSTGGGASLEFLAGKSLPGVEALSDATSMPV